MNMKLSSHRSTARQVAASIVLIVGTGILAFGGFGCPKRQAAVPPINQAQPAAAQPADEIDALTISAPSIEVPSASAMPALETSSFNLTSATLPSQGIFKDISVKADTTYSYKLDIAVPAIDIKVPDLPKAGTTAGTGTGSTGSSGAAGSEQGTVSAANCSQFAGMPSAQYCSSIPDPNGQTLCNQCKNAGY